MVRDSSAYRLAVGKPQKSMQHIALPERAINHLTLDPNLTLTEPLSGDRTKCIALADKIVELLKKGIQLSTGVVEFIDSTTSPTSIDQLATILETRDSSDAETLLELLFFPDLAFQIKLEPLLQRHPLRKADIACLLEQLYQRKLWASFVFPDQEDQLVLEMPKSVVAPFVSRLNLTRQLPSRLVKEIQRTVALQTVDKVKVILRNFRTPLSDTQTDFLCRFFQKMTATGKPFCTHLEMVLQVMDETGAGMTIYQALMKKKRSLLHHLHSAIKFEERRRHHAMETLMLGGERVAHIHPADAMHTVALIDATALAVFGSTEVLPPKPFSRAVGRLSETDDMRSLMNIFDSDPTES